MIDDTILNYIIIFILFEIYEISWQKANTIMGMLARMYGKYSQSIIRFLLMQPTFIYSIGFAMICEFNGYATTLLIIKAIDVATKIVLLDKIFNKKELSDEMTLALLAPIHFMVPYIGLFLYPTLIFLALN
ncbi:hypothetical protein N9A28_04770 [Sulfurimonas sp.]|nr:hypothetical protein [Sulfurimonas sp.]